MQDRNCSISPRLYPFIIGTVIGIFSTSAIIFVCLLLSGDTISVNSQGHIEITGVEVEVNKR